MCVCAQRRRHSARQAEVGELDFLVVSVDQQILRLEITMEDAVRVAVRQTGQELKHEFLPRNRGLSERSDRSGRMQAAWKQA
jgi:hypothetical protein